MNKIEYEKQQEQKHIREYEKQFIKSRLMTTRFNESTEMENHDFREKNNHTGCIYNCPTIVSEKIPKDINLFVLEMNNDTNRIIGIGLVVHKLPINKNYKVHKNRDYNINTYIGKYRIERETMSPDEEFIMQVFDRLCFQGQNHMKRGQGITAFPSKILYRCRKIIDLVTSVEDMFKTRFKKPIEKKPI